MARKEISLIGCLQAIKDLATLEQQLQMERDEHSRELAQYEDMENQLNLCLQAIKDLATLEQQLQRERDERSRELAQYEYTENQLNLEREQVLSEALAAERQLDTDFKLLEEQESKTFEEQIEHADVNRRLKIIQAYFEEKEREETRRQEEEEMEAELKVTEIQRLHGTRIIQKAWRAYLKKKAAEAAHHKKSKKEGKGKGKASKDDKMESGSSKSKKAGSSPVKKTKK